jgi:hypothetical protein
LNDTLLEIRGRREGRPAKARPQPCVQMKKARKQVTTGTPERSGLPCASGFNGFLRALPGDRAFCHRRWQDAEHHRPLDASVEASEPHDFTVRLTRARLSRQGVHRFPRSTFVTIAKRPSRKGGMFASIAASTSPSSTISENQKSTRASASPSRLRIEPLRCAFKVRGRLAQSKSQVVWRLLGRFLPITACRPKDNWREGNP